jgi:hypothetical protein
MITLARLERELRRMVVESLEQERSSRDVEREIRVFMEEEGVAETLQEDLLRQATRQHGWISERTIDSSERRVVSELLTTTFSEFARVEDEILEGVVRAVDRGIRNNMPSGKLEELVARTVRGTRGNASVIVSTALAGFDRGKTWIEAEKAGVVRMKLVGTPPGANSHSWCRDHYGKTYTREQIRGMSNGTVLSVELSCGGWNCVHTWQAVID